MPSDWKRRLGMTAVTWAATCFVAWVFVVWLVQVGIEGGKLPRGQHWVTIGSIALVVAVLGALLIPGYALWLSKWSPRTYYASRIKGGAVGVWMQLLFLVGTYLAAEVESVFSTWGPSYPLDVTDFARGLMVAPITFLAGAISGPRWRDFAAPSTSLMLVAVAWPVIVGAGFYGVTLLF